MKSVTDEQTDRQTHTNTKAQREKKTDAEKQR